MNLLNIDIINKKVANESKISEKIVTTVNKYYWNKNVEHIRGLNLQPVNLMGIGYIRHSKILIRVKILKLVAKLRGLKHSKKYKPNGVKKLAMESYYQNQLRQLWLLRNIKTFEPNE